MTPSEALTVPIYTPTTIPTDSDSEGEDEGGAGARPKIKLCILCPGKILKNEHMVKVHLDSGVSLVLHPPLFLVRSKELAYTDSSLCVNCLWIIISLLTTGP